MVTKGQVGVMAALALVALAGFAPVTWAQEEAGDAAEAAASMDWPTAVRGGMVAIAAALAMMAAALGTAKVQAAIGAGGTGALAEKPDLFVSIVILIAIPETIIVLGFVMSLLLWTKI
jgi:V/A-type H+-transporting ATPase subunit K